MSGIPLSSRVDFGGGGCVPPCLGHHGVSPAIVLATQWDSPTAGKVKASA